MAVSSSSSLLLLFLVFGFAAAAAPRDIYLKKDAWKIPTSESDSLNKWAQTVRFQIGDHLSNYHFLHFFFFVFISKNSIFMFLFYFPLILPLLFYK
jgi:hypothetical protein